MNSSLKIALRAPELSDLNTIHRWENDKSLWHLSNTILPFSRFSIEQYILSEQEDIFSNYYIRELTDFHLFFTLLGKKAMR